MESGGIIVGTITIFPETTKLPITLIGHRAGICWGADVTDDKKNFRRGLDCISSGHGRTFEFVDVHMLIDGYSARAIREYTRHVGGLTPWLQESTRYIDYSDFNAITPNSVKSNGEATVLYNKALKDIRRTLEELDNLGVSREDVANLLPLGMTTKIVEKRNLRNLADMSHVRKCSRACWEIRKLFSDIEKALREYSEEWKVAADCLFMPKCGVFGFCNEKKSCGRMPKRGNIECM